MDSKIVLSAIIFYSVLTWDRSEGNDTSAVGVSERLKNATEERPIKMAYTLFEITDADKEDDTKKHPIVIMHGLLGSKKNWDSLSRSIRNRTMHKIIAVDARNHGESPHTQEFNYPCIAEDVHYLMTDLNMPKINAIGHSLGGRAMMYLALKYPHLVNSLIVVDISPLRMPSAVNDVSAMMNAMQAIKFESNITLSKARKMVDQQLMEAIPDIPVRQFLLTNLVQNEDGRYGWRLNLDSLVDHFSSVINFEPPQNKFEGPVLFIGGGKSTFLSTDDHESIRNYFPRAEFRYIQNAGHWVQSEKPAEFLDLACEFLNKI